MKVMIISDDKRFRAWWSEIKWSGMNRLEIEGVISGDCTGIVMTPGGVTEANVYVA